MLLRIDYALEARSISCPAPIIVWPLVESMIDTQSSVSWSQLPDFPLRSASWSWFRGAATRSLEQTAQRHGLLLQVNMADLGAAFFRWCSILEDTRTYERKNPVDYAHFAGGVLLECLLGAAPVQANRSMSVDAMQLPLRTLLNWPAGFSATSLALTHLDAQLRFLGRRPCRLDLGLMDKHWNSLRENAVDDPDSVGPFFDLFCGLEPNWNPPFTIDRRPGMG